MDNLRKERDNLKQQVLDLTKRSNCFSYAFLKENIAKSPMLTGLKFNVLETLLVYLTRRVEYGRSCTKEELYNQILLTIIKLRHNLSFELLALICRVSKQTAINHFWKWIDIMYQKLKFLIRMQDRDHIFKAIPPIFKAKFPGLTSIIDLFEVFVESPQSLMARAQMYSQYKKHCTIKVLISCTPVGAINFVSQCWGGRASDIQIVRQSGFHLSKYHMPGDQILTDRGFTLQDDFAAGSELIIPSFTKGKSQLSAREVEDSRKIASIRIHIESHRFVKK